LIKARVVTHPRACHIEAASGCPVFRLEKVEGETVVAGRTLLGGNGDDD